MTKRLLAAVIASVLLIALVIVFADLRRSAAVATVRELLVALDLRATAAALTLYLLTHVGRAARLAILLPGVSDLGHLTSICLRHNLLNLLLPFRTGEATLPLLLKVEAGTGLGEGAVTLAVARLFDLAAMATFGLVGLLLVFGDGEAAIARRVALPLALAIGLLVFMRPIARALRRPMSALPRIGAVVAAALDHLAGLPSLTLVKSAAVSLLLWLTNYATLYLLIVAMRGATVESLGLDGVGFAESLVGSTFLHLTTVLPINTVAGIGSWEAGWTAGYVFVGVGQNLAFASAVVSHLLMFGFLVVMAAVAFVTSASRSRQ